MNEMQVIRKGVLDMQVCVPEGADDEAVETFANRENQSGTRGGWRIRRQGSKFLAGANERTPCEERRGCVHITLDC
jgi:hypothetical protein